MPIKKIRKTVLQDCNKTFIAGGPAYEKVRKSFWLDFSGLMKTS